MVLGLLEYHLHNTHLSYPWQKPCHNIETLLFWVVHRRMSYYNLQSASPLDVLLRQRIIDLLPLFNFVKFREGTDRVWG